MEYHPATMTRGVGSLDWLVHTGGRLTHRERIRLGAGALLSFLEGLRLWSRSRRNPRRRIDLSGFDPPDTPMVRASKELLARVASPEMAHHSYRTAYRGLDVLDQFSRVTDVTLETLWVAALLHDIGLEAPPETGDFSLAGVLAVERLAGETGWSPEQAFEAKQAISSNLGTYVVAREYGSISWAMNVGGTGEVTYGPHRAVLHPEAAAELERRFPRSGFRASALELIQGEARRVPDGRFAFALLAFRAFLRA